LSLSSPGINRQGRDEMSSQSENNKARRWRPAVTANVVYLSLTGGGGMGRGVSAATRIGLVAARNAWMPATGMLHADRAGRPPSPSSEAPSAPRARGSAAGRRANSDLRRMAAGGMGP
jgi:hypothetical protein